MLVLSGHRGDKIHLLNTETGEMLGYVMVSKIREGEVRLGFEIDRKIEVLRDAVLERINATEAGDENLRRTA